MDKQSYEHAVESVSTLKAAMELLGECSTCVITCCFEGGVLYIEPVANDIDGNGLTIAIEENGTMISASICEGQPKE